VHPRIAAVAGHKTQVVVKNAEALIEVLDRGLEDAELGAHLLG